MLCYVVCVCVRACIKRAVTGCTTVWVQEHVHAPLTNVFFVLGPRSPANVQMQNYTHAQKGDLISKLA